MIIKNIFLVDQDYFFATSFIKKFKIRGDYNIQHFESFEEALKEIPAQDPQMILIEQKLKGKTGLEAIPHIKKSTPNCQIVMVSNQTDIDVVEKAYENGVAKYFRKDILLIDHIEGFIKEKETLVPSWRKIFA